MNALPFAPAGAPLLSPLAVKNIDTLQALAAPPADVTSSAALARHFNRDKSNFAKTIAALAEEGLCRETGALPELTPDGHAALDAWARAHGAAAEPQDAPVVEIAFDQIDAWDKNPRKWFDPKTLPLLARSIGDDGILQPITVRPKANGRFEVIIGERRRRAAAIAVREGWRHADFRVPCQVREFTDADAEDVAGVENIQRDDMHWYDLAQHFRHLMDDRGLSGPQLERRFGKAKYSARKIQDYAKIARELPREKVEKVYLPTHLDEDDEEKRRPNPDCLTYVKARDLVGEKKAPPAIALPPRSALCLLELVHAATAETSWRQGDNLTATLHTAPAGGPIAALNSHPDNLLTLGFDDGKHMVARIPATEKLIAWLNQLGWIETPHKALAKARADVLGGDLAVAALGDTYVTPELNPPPQRAVAPPLGELPPQAGEGASPPEHDPMAPGIGAQILAPPDADTPDYLRRLAGPGPAPAAPATPELQAGAAASPSAHAVRAPASEGDLPAMLAILLVEIAHKVSVDGHERGPGTWATPLMSGWQDDTRVGKMTREQRLLAILPLGERTLATVTRRGLDWLLANATLVEVMGRPQMTDEALADQQARLMGGPPARGLYHTPWLNPSPPSGPDGLSQEAAPATAESEGAGDAVASASTYQEDEADGDAASALPAPAPILAAQERALLACYGELGQLDALLGRLRSNASKSHQAEIDQHRQLIEAIRDTARANLPSILNPQDDAR